MNRQIGMLKVVFLLSAGLLLLLTVLDLVVVIPFVLRFSDGLPEKEISLAAQVLMVFAFVGYAMLARWYITFPLAVVLVLCWLRLRSLGVY